MTLKIKIKRLGLLGICVLLATLCTAQYAVSKIPKELLENANTVVRYNFMDYEIISPRKTVEKTKYVVTLLNEKSRGNIHPVRYDKYSKVSKFQAKVFDTNGKLVKSYKKEDIKDESAVSSFSIYEDSRVKYFEIAYEGYPFTIEYEYEVKTTGVYAYPYKYFANYYSSCEAAFFSVTIPNDMSFRYRTPNMEVEPSINKLKDSKKYIWGAKNIPAKVYERYAPHRYETLPMLCLAPNEVHVEKYQGNLKDWKSYGQFLYELNEGRDEVSPELRVKIKGLTAKAKSDREKIEILYKYLQENNRYVSVQLGIGGWQTFDAKYVEKNKYGDCKALSNFMKSMLKVVGIKAYAVSIDSGDNPRVVHKDFATPYSFNHKILYVPESDVWLECTSKEKPFNYLGGSNMDREVLMVTESGGQIKRTPTVSIKENGINNKAEVVLLPTGEAALKNVELIKGPEHDGYRGSFSDGSQSDLEEWFYESREMPSFKIKAIDIQIAPDKPEAKLTYDLSIPRYASKAGKRLFVPVNCINPFSAILPQDDNRIHPINISFGGEGISYDDQIALQLPEGYEVESIPEKEIQIDSEYGSYTVNIVQEGNKINYSRKLELKSIELPPEKYKELRDFYKGVTKADKMKLVLVKKKS